MRHLAQEAPPLTPPIEAEDVVEEKTNEDGTTRIHLLGGPLQDLVTKQPEEAKAKDHDEEDEKPASGPDVPVADDSGSPKTHFLDLTADCELPKVSYDDARRLMKRTDFFDGLDHANVSGFESDSFLAEARLALP